MDLEHDLRIKYGLSVDPPRERIARWARRAAELAAEAGDAEQAGRAAALEVFGELDRTLYFSAADTIETLLARARAK